MIKIFIDTSVLLAGLNSPQGGSAVILGMIKKRTVKGFVSSLVIKEVCRNLANKFPKINQTEWIKFIAKSNLEKVKINSENDIKRFRSFTVEKDVHVLAGAFLSHADYLISLDKKHLLSVNNRSLPFKIYSPKLFLEEFNFKLQ